MLTKACGPTFDEHIETLQSTKPNINMDIVLDQCVQC